MLFFNSEKKTLITMIRSFFTNLIITFFLSCIFFIIAFFIHLNGWLIAVFLLLYLLLLTIFAVWWSIIHIGGFIKYFYQEFKRNRNIRIEFLKIFSSFSPNRKHKKHIQRLKFLIAFSSGVTSVLMFLTAIQTDSSKNTPTNWVVYILLSFLFAVLFIFVLKEDIKSYSTHFKYVDSYKNSTPFNLYLERIVDNSTHILSDENNEYRAIKYLNNENFDFVIRLYKLEKREISPPSNNVENNSESEITEGSSESEVVEDSN